MPQRMLSWSNACLQGNREGTSGHTHPKVACKALGRLLEILLCHPVLLGCSSPDVLLEDVNFCSDKKRVRRKVAAGSCTSQSLGVASLGARGSQGVRGQTQRAEAHFPIRRHVT